MLPKFNVPHSRALKLAGTAAALATAAEIYVTTGHGWLAVASFASSLLSANVIGDVSTRGADAAGFDS